MSYNILDTISTAISQTPLPADASDLDERTRAALQKRADAQGVTLQQMLDVLRAAQGEQARSNSAADTIAANVRAARNGVYPTR